MAKLTVSDARAFEGYEGEIVQIGHAANGELYRLVSIVSPSELEVEKVDG